MGLAPALIVGLAARAVIDVCPACAVTSLHEAVAAAPSGALIRVQAATYAESGITITRPLAIVGVPGAGGARPVIDGGLKGDVLVIRADGVSVSGLAIRNSGFSYLDDYAAIQVNDAAGCRIADNELTGNFFGIHVTRSRGCVIERNRIEGADREESAAGNGVHVWNGQNMTIRDNRITRNRDGIYFEFVTDSSITGNRSVGNLRYGLHFMFSHGNLYEQNVFSRNSSGVAVMYSRNIRMVANLFEDSWGGAAYGILMKELSASEITGNTFHGNTVGIYMEGTTRSRVNGNRFVSNGWAMRVLGDCDSNRFEHNDFVSNTFDASTNSSANLNVYTDNFWSAYQGLDLNHDGIGDTPYRPVRLSSVLMEQYGVSVLLLKSFLFAVADQAEAAFPLLTPDAFRDDHPRMNPWNEARSPLR